MPGTVYLDPRSVNRHPERVIGPPLWGTSLRMERFGLKTVGPPSNAECEDAAGLRYRRDNGS